MNDDETSKITLAKKLHIRISLEKSVVPNDDPKIQIHIRNNFQRNKVFIYPLVWINLYDHQIVTMKTPSEPKWLHQC